MGRRLFLDHGGVMRHLWQRIFAYALVLVVVSQLAVLFLPRYSVSQE